MVDAIVLAVALSIDATALAAACGAAGAANTHKVTYENAERLERVLELVAVGLGLELAVELELTITLPNGARRTLLARRLVELRRAAPRALQGAHRPEPGATVDQIAERCIDGLDQLELLGLGALDEMQHDRLRVHAANHLGSSSGACTSCASPCPIANAARNYAISDVVTTETWGMSGAGSPGMLMPSVDRYMTREPYSIRSTASLDLGRQLMSRHDIHHLPVVDGDRLVGMISDRDIAVVEVVPGVDLSHVEVSRVMSPPVEVWGETPLDEVSELMARQRTDYVVVRGGHGLEGIFTSVDALVALSDLLRRAVS